MILKAQLFKSKKSSYSMKKRRKISKTKVKKEISLDNIHKEIKTTINKSSYGKKIFLIGKLFLLILLGFLPSFIFTVLFVQYGSPLSNYIQFISNLKSSWIAWISAVVIVFFILFIRKLTKSKNKLERLRKNKSLMILVILCLVGLFVLIALQSYLYVNFLLKNDILVKLSASKENIYFTNTSKEDVTFQIAVTSNPFCSSECNYSFVDVSSGEVIDRDSFLLNSISSKYKTYTLEKEELVEGSQTIRRFEVSCKSKKTAMCYTKEKESKRAILITLNYNLNESELELKQASKENITLFHTTLYAQKLKLNQIYQELTNATSLLDLNSSFQEYNSLFSSYSHLNDSFNTLLNLWEVQNFELLLEQTSFFNSEINNFSILLNNFSTQVTNSLNNYNHLVFQIESSKQTLKQISQENLSDDVCISLNNKTIWFNNQVANFKLEPNLANKQVLVENLAQEILSFNNSIHKNNPNFNLCSLTATITNITLLRVNFFPINFSMKNYSLSDPVPVCCFYGKCTQCCKNDCNNTNYPIIFLHGHSINRQLPADYSLDVFSEIKQKLILGNYLDAGAIILSSIKEEPGLWGKLNVPILTTGSYFFDTHKVGNTEITVASTTESIDTYAIRLKELVKLMKLKTGKDKVIIVAHSMGGLVTRRYIQIFGAGDIDKIILITVPNHGIQDKIKDYCGVLGSEIACKEMDKDSTFINQLNTAPSEKVETYNIIGIGCNMGEETGDGVLKESSQYLELATNYYVNGSCNELSFEFLHETIMFPDRYPKMYNILQDIL